MLYVRSSQVGERGVVLLTDSNANKEIYKSKPQSEHTRREKLLFNTGNQIVGTISGREACHSLNSLSLITSPLHNTWPTWPTERKAGVKHIG